MSKKTVILFILLSGILIFNESCRHDPDYLFDDSYTLNTPSGFPAPAIPDDNTLTKNRISLGKKLFYDKRLSVDNTISCASCHIQQHGFSDTSSLSHGVSGRTGIRNAPALINLAWMNSFMRDGGVPTLELQILAPLQDHNEMASDINATVTELKDDDYYAMMSQRAYNRDFDPFVLTRAISAFERTLISGNSRYDKFLRGEITLTSSETNGMNMFFSAPFNCSSCHSGFNFTDLTFQNNGLYQHYADTGRARITLRPEDSGKFRVPTLRNVAQTAPYMFDGSLATLSDVVDHYASGGANHPNKSPLINGFTLTSQEKTDLINFLNCLTDNEFLNNSAFREN